MSDNTSDLQSLETYLKSLNLDFIDYIRQYDNLLNDSKENTNNYVSVFSEIIKDFNSEINTNTTQLQDCVSKLNQISDKLPYLEDLYEKVHEMRLSLELIYKQIKINKG